MTRPIVIIGFGGHGRVVAAAFAALRRQVIAATVLCPKPTDPQFLGIEIMSDESMLARYRPEDVLLSLGIGSVGPTNDHSLTRQTVKSFQRLGYSFVGFQHPAAWIAQGATISATAQVHAGAIVQPGAAVGEFSILNTKASIDHDCLVGEFCHIAPGATLSGGVSVGDGSHLGTGCSVIQGIQIGRSSFVAAGATVVRDVADGEFVRGVPAKCFPPIKLTK